MLALVLSAALALTSHGSAHEAGHLPAKGVVVPGVSFAGVKIGDTEARVKAVWGTRFVTCATCTDTTWLRKP